ncbi:MAG: hypothetical protein ABIZ80_24760 [Bryobacteraceae bacterium]
MELAVPFGTIAGKLMLLGDFMVFVDDREPANSFVIPKEQIANITAGPATLIETKSPIIDKSGPHTRFSFRFPNEADPAAVTRWQRSSGATAAAPSSSIAAKPSAASVSDEKSYKVRHDHRVGSCHGRLAITVDRVIYESINDIGDSRNWQFRDIKEMKQNNPYKLTIEPFSGAKYTLTFDGESVDPAVYKALEDRVAAARVAR